VNRKRKARGQPRKQLVVSESTRPRPSELGGVLPARGRTPSVHLLRGLGHALRCARHQSGYTVPRVADRPNLAVIYKEEAPPSEEDRAPSAKTLW
jgi:hypothetical protein